MQMQAVWRPSSLARRWATPGRSAPRTRRVIVVGDRPDVVDTLAAAVATMSPRNPIETGHAVGPLISEVARQRVLDAIDGARASGGTVLAGGNQPAKPPGPGWYIEPTLITDLPRDHQLACEEVFGPLAIVQHVDTVDDAVELANSVRYGLVSSVHGRDLDAVLALAARLQTGLVKVNAPTSGVDFYAPFGGDKDSSYGPQREQGMAALDFYSTTRTIAIVPHGS